LGGAHKLAYLNDMSRFLRSVRLALHHARLILQRFPSLIIFRVIPAKAGIQGFSASPVSRFHGNHEKIARYAFPWSLIQRATTGRKISGYNYRISYSAKGVSRDYA
jgi:hypothetical protein